MERRRTVRFEPTPEQDEVLIRTEQTVVPGVAGNVSEGGICVIVFGGVGLEIGQKVQIQFMGRFAPAVVRNVTSDIATEAYGLEWVTPIVPELAELLK